MFNRDISLSHNLSFLEPIDIHEPDYTSSKTTNADKWVYYVM